MGNNIFAQTDTSYTFINPLTQSEYYAIPKPKLVEIFNNSERYKSVLPKIQKLEFQYDSLLAQLDTVGNLKKREVKLLEAKIHEYEVTIAKIKVLLEKDETEIKRLNKHIDKLNRRINRLSVVLTISGCLNIVLIIIII